MFNIDDNKTARNFSLLTRAGKMNRISRCDWLPEQERRRHLAYPGLLAVPHKKNLPEDLKIKYKPLLTKQSRWLDIGLVYFMSSWTLTLSRSVKRRNLANVQPSWVNKLANSPYDFCLSVSCLQIFAGCVVETGKTMDQSIMNVVDINPILTLLTSQLEYRLEKHSRNIFSILKGYVILRSKLRKNDGHR